MLPSAHPISVKPSCRIPSLDIPWCTFKDTLLGALWGGDQKGIGFRNQPSSAAAIISEATACSEVTGYISGCVGGTKSEEESCGSLCRQAALAAPAGLCKDTCCWTTCPPHQLWVSVWGHAFYLELGPDQGCLKMGPSGLQSYLLLELPPDSCLPAGRASGWEEELRGGTVLPAGWAIPLNLLSLLHLALWWAES